MKNAEIREFIKVLSKIKSYKDIKIQGIDVPEDNDCNDENILIEVKFNGIKINCFIYHKMLATIAAFFYYKKCPKALKLVQNIVIEFLESHWENEYENSEHGIPDDLMNDALMECRRLSKYEKRS